MTTIVTVTLSPAVDLSSEAERVVPIHKVRTSNDSFDPGGGGINVARVVTELGGDALAISFIGGTLGALLDELLERENIKRRLLQTAVPTRLSHMIYERQSGHEFRFVPTGHPLRPEDLAACLAAVEEEEFRYLVLSGSVPPGTPEGFVARIGDVAAAKRAKFVLDSSGPGLAQTLGRTSVHLVKPSAGELAAYMGRPLRDHRDQESAAGDLVRQGLADIVAVTLGSQGAILATRDRVIRAAAPEVVVKSAVGAGDSFLGAMTLALSQGRSTEDAFRLGMAAGAAAVLTPGTKLCRKADVARLFEEMTSGSVSLVGDARG